MYFLSVIEPRACRATQRQRSLPSAAALPSGLRVAGGLVSEREGDLCTPEASPASAGWPCGGGGDDLLQVDLLLDAQPGELPQVVDAPPARLSALPLERAEGAEAVLAGAVVEALVHLGQVLRPALLALEGVGAGLPQQGALGVKLGLLDARLAAFGIEKHARGEVADAGLAPVQQFLSDFLKPGAHVAGLILVKVVLLFFGAGLLAEAPLGRPPGLLLVALLVLLLVLLVLLLILLVLLSLLLLFILLVLLLVLLFLVLLLIFFVLLVLENLAQVLAIDVVGDPERRQLARVADDGLHLLVREGPRQALRRQVLQLFNRRKR